MALKFRFAVDFIHPNLFVGFMMTQFTNFQPLQSYIIICNTDPVLIILNLVMMASAMLYLEFII